MRNLNILIKLIQMLIPLIEKDATADDFTCRDGEIEFRTGMSTVSDSDDDYEDIEGIGPADDMAEIKYRSGYGIKFSLTAEGDYPGATIRIPLQAGDAEKVSLMMQGQMSRVDAATLERITDLIVKKAADEFSDMIVENRRLGLHLLPFRVFGMIRSADGTLGNPSAQAVILPLTTPPYPEITAHAIADDTLNLSIRFPVKPQRLRVAAPPGMSEGSRVETYVSYPLFIPDGETAKGSLGSVRSIAGGNSLGIRFSFLSIGKLKYSVAAPEKYYQLIGNENTGYRCASKAVALPDYSEYAGQYGYVPPFAIEAMRQQGCGESPLEWIADWERHGEGYLPMSLPYKYRSVSAAGDVIPDGIDSGYIDSLVASTGKQHLLLTRPMAFADAEKSRRKATPKSVEWMRVHGMEGDDSVAVLFGSCDGVNYEPLRRFNPAKRSLLLSPLRIWHRLLLLSSRPFPKLCVEVGVKS